MRRAHPIEEILAIVERQPSVEDRIALLLMGRLGFRKNDVRLFKAADVDLRSDTVHIRCGKGGKPATLPIIFEQLRESLKLWLEHADADYYLWHPRGERRRPLDLSSVHRRFKRCLARAYAEDFPMHELRHSAADHLWRASGGDLDAAQMLLRHASPQTTEIYLHRSVEDLRSRMSFLDEASTPDKEKAASVG